MTSTGPIERMWTSPVAYGRHAAPPFETTRSKSAVLEAASTVPAPISELASSVPPSPSASARRVNQLMVELLGVSSCHAIAAAGGHDRTRTRLDLSSGEN